MPIITSLFIHLTTFQKSTTSLLQNYNKLILTLSWRSSQPDKNRSFDLLCKSMNWFLYDRDLRNERVNQVITALKFDLIISGVTQAFCQIYHSKKMIKVNHNFLLALNLHRTETNLKVTLIQIWKSANIFVFIWK